MVSCPKPRRVPTIRELVHFHETETVFILSEQRPKEGGIGRILEPVKGEVHHPEHRRQRLSQFRLGAADLTFGTRRAEGEASEVSTYVIGQADSTIPSPQDTQ